LSRTPNPSALEGVVAFTDLVGYTEYTATRGDAQALALLGAQDRIVAETLPAQARVVKELGDGLLLYFAEPTSAIRACLKLLAGFERATMEDTMPLWVRIGLHWGRPTRRGTDLVGHDVNVAARIVDIAAPGELVCSSAAVMAAGTRLEGIDFVELGPVVMKGIPTPIELYRASHALSPSSEVSAS
jgi:class 3 adenylate cyclase